MAATASSFLAVVPAYNEGESVAGVVRSLHRAGTPVRRDRDRRRLDRRHRAARRQRPAHRSSGCRSTSGSAAPFRPGFSTRSRTATTTWRRSTATGSTSRASSPDWWPHCDRIPSLDMVCGSRFVSVETAGTGPDQPPDRDPSVRLRAQQDPRPAGHRSDLRVPALQPAGDPPVRRGLPQRLP